MSELGVHKRSARLGDLDIGRVQQEALVTQNLLHAIGQSVTGSGVPILTHLNDPRV